jgi:hypothetical protein
MSNQICCWKLDALALACGRPDVRRTQRPARMVAAARDGSGWRSEIMVASPLVEVLLVSVCAPSSATPRAHSPGSPRRWHSYCPIEHALTRARRCWRRAVLHRVLALRPDEARAFRRPEQIRHVIAFASEFYIVVSNKEEVI